MNIHTVCSYHSQYINQLPLTRRSWWHHRWRNVLCPVSEWGGWCVLLLCPLPHLQMSRGEAAGAPPSSLLQHHEDPAQGTTLCIHGRDEYPPWADQQIHSECTTAHSESARVGTHHQNVLNTNGFPLKMAACGGAYVKSRWTCTLMLHFCKQRLGPCPAACRWLQG